MEFLSRQIDFVMWCDWYCILYYGKPAFVACQKMDFGDVWRVLFNEIDWSCGLCINNVYRGTNSNLINIWNNVCFKALSWYYLFKYQSWKKLRWNGFQNEFIRPLLCIPVLFPSLALYPVFFFFQSMLDTCILIKNCLCIDLKVHWENMNEKILVYFPYVLSLRLFFSYKCSSCNYKFFFFSLILYN